MPTTKQKKYDLGRALAAFREAKMEFHGQPEAETAYEHEQRVGREIEEAGGWDDEVQRGYDEARREYAAERTPWN